MKRTFLDRELFRFKCALKGICYGFLRESHFRFQLLFMLIVLATGFWFQIQLIEWAVIILAIGLVLVSEMVNTVVEDIMDFVHPETDKKVGLIKDLASGSVLMSVIIAVAIGLIVFIPYLMKG